MKNNLLKSAAIVAALAAVMTGCNNEELAGDGKQPQDGKVFTVTASTPGNGANTRLEYDDTDLDNKLGVKWKANNATEKEQFYAFVGYRKELYGARFTRLDEGVAAHRATFSLETWSTDLNAFKPDPIYPGDKYFALYPTKSDYNSTFTIPAEAAAAKTITLPLTAQKGTLADIQDFDYMTASGTPQNEADDDETAQLNLRFKHRIAVMRLAGLTFDGLTAGNAEKVTISATGLCNSATLTIDMTSFATTGGITLGADGAIETSEPFAIGTDSKIPDVYICFFPGNVDETGTHEITDLKVTATVGSDTYEYSYGEDADVTEKVTKFEEGKMYTLSGKTMKMKKLDDVTIDNLNWAVGNLISDGKGGCKIGDPNDGGLYFQLGSLVGWAGGETGDGTGRGTNSITPALSIVAKPANLTTANETWRATGKVWLDETAVVPFTDKNSGSANEIAGLGDPCRYYLGGTWRLPTKTEYSTLINNNSKYGWTDATGWTWAEDSKTAIYNKGYLILPATTSRHQSSGNLDNLGGGYEYGYYWYASPYGGSSGYGGILTFKKDFIRMDATNQMGGLPVRCVRSSN